MNLADLLTYADIEQLQKIAGYYELPHTHSKHELIKSLLSSMQRPSWWSDRVQAMSRTELRFWQLLLLDSREAFNLEELVGKGRQALHESEGSPRSFVAKAIKSGLLFPGVTRRDYSLYQVPSDVRKQVIRALRSRIAPGVMCEQQPMAYRDEQYCMVEDLETFLAAVGENNVRLTADLTIYRNDLQTILRKMAVQEKPIDKQKWRFGFGRRYHQYPDRFSLLYDYAYYRQFIAENGPTLCLTVPLSGKNIQSEEGAEQLYNFWLRLYRKPIPTLPLIIKWIYLLAHTEWVYLSGLQESLNEWLSPYYYLGEKELFDLVVKMLTHLGVIRLSDVALQMTENGNKWVERSTGWDLSELDDRFTTVHGQNFFINQQGISELTLNK